LVIKEKARATEYGPVLFFSSLYFISIEAYMMILLNLQYAKLTLAQSAEGLSDPFQESHDFALIHTT
jgi:hypothetical protein